VSRDPNRPWWMPIATAAGAAVVRLLGRTWRLEIVGEAGHARGRAPGGKPAIFAFWHARLLPLVFVQRGSGAAVLVSRSRDGELIAGILVRLGFTVARGSSTRGGHEGLMEMLRWGAEGRGLGVTPDGPRGPAEQLTRGLVPRARRRGLPVTRGARAATAAWVLRSWDRFRVPRPFAHVVAGYGEPIAVPAGLDEAGIESWRRRLEDALREHTKAVELRAGEAP